MKKSKVQEVDIARLAVNEGQLEWLPKNPRQWTKEDINNTMQSIREDPDFLEDRPALVTPLDKGLLVFAGNLRFTAAKKAGLKTIPAIMYTPENDADRETIKRRAVKDNGSFGAWDWDLLANEWDDGHLNDWGVKTWGGPKYEPNLTPIDGVAPVTDADIAKAGEHIAEEVQPSEKQVVEIVCPHCGKTFKFSI